MPILLLYSDDQDMRPNSSSICPAYTILRYNLFHVFCALIKGNLGCVRVGINRTKIPCISVSSTQIDIDCSLKVPEKSYVNTE